jgi:hypothetical protein
MIIGLAAPWASAFFHEYGGLGRRSDSGDAGDAAATGVIWSRF